MMKANTAAKIKKYSLRILKHLFLISVCVVFAFPVFWGIIISLKTQSEIFTAPIAFPEVLQWNNYVEAFQKMEIWRVLGNTLLICVGSISVGLACVVMVCFAVTRMKFGDGKLQERVYNYFILGMIIPNFVLLFPIYMMNSKFGIVDSLWGVILPYWGWTAPMHTLLIAGAFRGIPLSIDEAAIIDGAKPLQVLIRVLLPLLKPALMTSLIICVLGCWNEYPLSSITLISEKNLTVVMTLSKFKGQFSSNYALTSAGAMILTIPQIIFFTCFQKQIVGGMTSGAVKG